MNTSHSCQKATRKTAMEFPTSLQLDSLTVPDGQSIFGDLFEYSSMAGISYSFMDSPVALATKQEGSTLLGDDDLFAEDLCSGFMGESLGSEQDWLAQSLPLPTPDEQKGDILTFTAPPPAPSPQPPTSLDTTTTNISSSSSASASDFNLSFLPTPETSLPGSPLSSHSSPTSFYSEEDEIYDVMTSMLGGDSEEMQGFVPNQPLPLSSPFAMASSDTTTAASPLSSSHNFYGTSPQDSFLTSPHTPPQEPPFLTSPGESYSVSSPALSGYSASSPILVEDGDSSSIRGLLKAEQDSLSSCRKRKLPETQVEVKTTRPAATKRRMSQATKRERKREQNKTAALRYRRRKKGEKSEIEVRKQELEEVNSSLKSKVSSLEAEMNYLKQLWSDIEKRKRLMKQ